MAANVRHSSESVQHYTPRDYAEAARRVMGGIDLDPFSCELANRTVRAARYFCGWDGSATREHVGLGTGGLVADGFAESWERPLTAENFNTRGKYIEGSRVLCNPPGGTFAGGASRQVTAWFKSVREWRAGRASAVVFVCFSLEILQRSQQHPERLTDEGALQVPLDFPICYPARRVAYERPITRQVPTAVTEAGFAGKVGRFGPCALPGCESEAELPHDHGLPGVERGAQPPHASCFVLLPDIAQALRPTIGSLPPEWADHPQVRAFRREFGQFGRVVVPT